jgi:hypothetical protein
MKPPAHAFRNGTTILGVWFFVLRTAVAAPAEAAAYEAQGDLFYYCAAFENPAPTNLYNRGFRAQVRADSWQIQVWDMRATNARTTVIVASST